MNKKLVFLSFFALSIAMPSCNSGSAPDKVESVVLTTTEASYAETQQIGYSDFSAKLIRQSKKEEPLTSFKIEEFGEDNTYTFTDKDKEEGTKTFTVKYYDLVGTTKVNVTDKVPVQSMKVDRHIVLLDETSNTRTVQLNAKVYPEDATNKGIKWETSNKFVAEVSESGLVSIPNEVSVSGECIITATSKDNDSIFEESYTINVGKLIDKHVQKVNLNKNTLQIPLNKTGDLVATVFPEDASIPYVVWKSSDESVAKVDDAGVITPVKLGKATISAIAVDGYKQADCEVEITGDYIDVKDVTLSHTELHLEKDGTIKLGAHVLPSDATNQKLIYTSENPAIARVNKDTGVIYAHKAGETKIRVAADDNPTQAYKECKVVVSEEHIPVTGIEVNPNPIHFDEGSKELTQTLQVSVIPSDATDKRVRFSSTDPNYASVDRYGVVTAREAAPEKTDVKIIVQSQSEPEAKAEIPVTIAEGFEIPLISLSVDQPILVLKTNELKKIQPIYNPSYTTQKGVKFELDGDETFKEAVKLGESAGEIIGVGTKNARGRVKVTSTKNPEIVGYCEVIYIGIPTIKFNNPIRNVKKGDTSIDLNPYSSNDETKTPLKDVKNTNLNPEICYCFYKNVEFNNYGVGYIKVSKDGFFDGLIKFDVSTLDEFDKTFLKMGIIVQGPTISGEELYMPTAYYDSDADNWIDITRVKSITHEFNHQNNIKKITLGAKIQVIEDETFSYCENLEYFDTNDAVYNLGKDTFLGCRKLCDVIIRSGGVAKIENNNSHFFDYVDTIRMNRTAYDAVTEWSYIKKNGLINFVIEDPDHEDYGICQKSNPNYLFITQAADGLRVFIDGKDLPSVNIPAYIKYNDKVQPVVELMPLEDESRCAELILPHTLKRIGTIKNNNLIKTVDMSRCYNIENFQDCKFSFNPNLESFALPASNKITKMPDESFQNDKKLSIKFVPNSVTSFGENAFRNIHDAEFEYPEYLSEVGKNCFRDTHHTGSVYFKPAPEDKKDLKLTISFDAYNNAGLEKLHFSQTLYYLHENAFEHACHTIDGAYAEYDGPIQKFKYTRLDDTSYWGARFIAVFSKTTPIMHCSDGDFNLYDN